MSILIFDTETTGFPRSLPFNDPLQPHAVQVACELWSHDEFMLDSFDFLINPGVPIPPSSTKIHGITDEMVTAEGKSPKEAIDRFMELAMSAEILVGHNVEFDVKIMAIMAARYYTGPPVKRVPRYCTMAESARHMPSKKRTNLSEAMRVFFSEEHAAHGAKADCEATRRIYFRLQTLRSES